MEEERYRALIADCAKDLSHRIFATADQAGIDRGAFLMNIATVLASSALAAQPEDQLAAASQHLQSALGLIHCQQEE